jgi:hypothetical protein
LQELFYLTSKKCLNYGAENIDTEEQIETRYSKPYSNLFGGMKILRIVIK